MLKCYVAFTGEKTVKRIDFDSEGERQSHGRRFALLGAGGYIAPRHLRAIHATGNDLVAAVDPKDSVGILDRFFPHTRFFTEVERFDRFMEKVRRQDRDSAIEYVGVCSPNYLHDAHTRLALRVGAHAICEKPLVISPWNLDALQEIEAETNRRVYTVLQLRLHPSIVELKQRLERDCSGDRKEVCLTYITRRGPWYHVSWKGSEEKSGGLAMNIGVHFFDILLWLFGEMESSSVHIRTSERQAGTLELARAQVRWFLSVEGKDLPPECVQRGQSAFRSITIDGEEVEFTTGFDDLHTRVYEEILAGNGFGIDDARPSLEVVHAVRTAEPLGVRGVVHPFLTDRSARRVPV